MTDKSQISILIDSAEQAPGIPAYDNTIRCPEHPDVESEDGYGLAGGGCGIYSMCGKCGRVLSKTQDSAEE